MLYARLCDLTIKIENIHPAIPACFGEYLNPEADTCDISLAVTKPELDAECEKYPEYDALYNEFVLIFKKLVPLMIPFGIFFFHSAAVSLDNNGYLFCGKSGQGKSTHAILWQDVLGAEVINSDKPLLKLEDDGIYAYGTPWSGKERLQKNTRVRIRAAAFIEQSSENSIKKLTSAEVLANLFNQTVYIADVELNRMLMSHLDRFLTEIPFYRLWCNISDDAVKLSYETLKKEI